MTGSLLIVAVIILATIFSLVIHLDAVPHPQEIYLKWAHPVFVKIRSAGSGREFRYELGFTKSANKGSVIFYVFFVGYPLLIQRSIPDFSEKLGI